MTPGDWLICGGLFVVVVFSIGTYVNSRAAVDQGRVYTDYKIKEVVGKVDKTIDNSETRFTSAAVCEERHESLNREIRDIKQIVQCVPQIKAGVGILLEKNGVDRKQMG